MHVQRAAGVVGIFSCNGSPETLAGVWLWRILARTGRAFGKDYACTGQLAGILCPQRPFGTLARFRLD